MRVITIKRTVSRKKSAGRFVRDFLSMENHIEFAIEALLFGALMAISAWPIAQAAEAINRLQ
jgi:hypothetical protein